MFDLLKAKGNKNNAASGGEAADVTHVKPGVLPFFSGVGLRG